MYKVNQQLQAQGLQLLVYFNYQEYRADEMVFIHPNAFVGEVMLFSKNSDKKARKPLTFYNNWAIINKKK